MDTLKAILLKIPAGKDLKGNLWVSLKGFSSEKMSQMPAFRFLFVRAKM
jgi:hypothetical protein